ncbi:MAG: insulinase family protein [Ignavibacteria bacterium]|nr:insulinase family protein [Ignavibacteria bacterium]
MNKLIQKLSPHFSAQQLDSHYQKTILENGIRVVTEEIPWVHSASLGVWFDVGSRDEHNSNSGIAHFLEHMVFKGTKNYSIKEISQSMESLGGYLNAFTTKEQTCFLARMLDEHIEKAIAVIADLVQRATFPEKELVKEKFVVLEELKDAEDDSEDFIHELLEKELFPHHQLGVPVIGTMESVKNFSREKLISFAREHYVPSKMVIAAAGNLKHSELVLLARKYFDTEFSTKHLAKRISPITKSKAKTQILERPIQQAHICTGTTTFSVHHPLRYSLLVLHTLLGDGMSSRLFQNIREKYGLAYTVYSFLNFMSDVSTFGVYIGTDAEKMENARELVQKELEKFATKPISKQELTRTKSQLKGTMMLSLESMSNRMMRLGSDELYFGAQTPLDTIRKRIDEVTVESVLETAQKVIDIKKFSTVVMKPGK